ncbi:MAG: streptomycin 6-kinase [Solirubrobacteraceae bacterium]|jgi:streptomycin 6-kinase|nr:streptomycin 6-kinase [Solirubrobacteraceae bacterium]
MDDETRRRLTTRFGAGIVDPWWHQLGWLIDDLARRWDLVRLGPHARGNTSVTLRCRAGTGRRKAVLKLTPDPALAVAEAAALKVWAGGPAVELLAIDAERGALLLEWLDAAPINVPAEAAAELVVALHAVPPPAGLPTLRARLPEGFDLAQRRGAAWADRREVALALAEDDVPPVLLHGDLHVRNVLVRGKRLVAIDPRPCVGDPAWDAADWVIGSRERCAVLAAAIGADPDRLWAWSEVFA